MMECSISFRLCKRDFLKPFIYLVDMSTVVYLLGLGLRKWATGSVWREQMLIVSSIGSFCLLLEISLSWISSLFFFFDL